MKKIGLVLLIMLLMSFTGCSKHKGPFDYNPELKSLEVGQDFGDGKYTLINRKFSKDYDGDMLLFEHKVSGGRIVYVAADDENKWFSAMFKTPAVDNTGVNHILEHTVLEGSELFPVKSPFTEMSKRSVSTYMNALTGSDTTVYPIASENQKDFDNLMRVYLDAVFSPLVVKDENLLMQEGWRYVKADSGANADAGAGTGRLGLGYNGVVFNEMRGALSDRYDWIYTQIPSALYPDTQYAYNSGGNPLNIVDLTHEGLKEAHYQYYHPKNALLVFYGNLDLNEKLAYVDSQYYGEFYEKNGDRDKAQLQNNQAPFGNTQLSEMEYPAVAGETAASDSFLSFSRSVNDLTFEDSVGLELLMTLMAGGYGKPLYDEVVSGVLADGSEVEPLGIELSGYLDTTYAQPMFHLLLEGASDTGMGDFEGAITRSLEGVVEAGFEGKAIEGAMNQYALRLKNALNTANKGENALYGIEIGFVTKDDPLYAINSLEALEGIKEKLKMAPGAEPLNNYFGDLVSRTLLNSDAVNTSEIIFKPNPRLTEDLNAQIEEKLEKHVLAMDEKARKELEEKIKGYEAYQDKPLDPVALDKLPKLTVKDIDMADRAYDQGKYQIDQAMVLEDVVDAHGVTGLKLYFSLEGLSKEEFTYLPVLVNGLMMVDSVKEGRGEIDEQLDGLTTGLGVETIYLQNDGDASDAKAYLVVGTEFLNGDAEKALEVVGKVLGAGDFDSNETLESAVNNVLNDVETTINGEGDRVSRMYQKANLTAAGAMEFHGIGEGYTRLRDHASRWDQDGEMVTWKVASLAKKILSPGRLVISAAADKEGQKGLREPLENLVTALDGEEIGVPSGNKDLFESKDQAAWTPVPAKRTDKRLLGVGIASEINYVDLGFHLSEIGHTLSGSDLVMMQYLSDGYMYERIRLQGGAYGGYCGVGRDNSVYFSAYRAPDYKTTLKAVEDLPKVLSSKSVSQGEIDNAIVTVIGRMNNSEDVFRGVDGGVLYYLMPSSVDGRQLMKEVLETGTDDISSFLDMLAKGLKIRSGVVAGPSDQLDGADFEDVVTPLQ